MKKNLLLFILALICQAGALKAQCIAPDAYGDYTVTACPFGTSTISTCSYKGEYVTVAFNITGTFSFDVYNTTSSSAHYLTITDNANNPIAFGIPPLQATIATAGDYFVHLTDPACGIETECHTITYECVLPACTGMPSAGTPDGTSYTICPGSTASFSVSGATQAGSISYEWQQSSSPTGPFTAVTGGTSSSPIAYTTPTLGATTYYQFVTTCTASVMSATTSVISVFTTKPAIECYCFTDLGGSECSGDNITNVEVLTTPLNNTSGCTTLPDGSTYEQYPPSATTTATLTTGNMYTFSINTTADNIISLWIDYDQNGTFDPSEHSQICTTSTPNTPTTYNLLVPTTASVGVTGMRIRSRGAGNTNGASDACVNFGSGETEDYVITIEAGLMCTGTPNAGTTPASFSICPGNSVTITSAGVTTSVGITYQWQESTSASGPFTNVTGGTGGNTMSYTTPTLSTAMYYQLVVTCTGSSQTATTNVTSVNINAPALCPCIPVYNNGCSGDQVDVVQIGTLNNTTNGCPSSPYYTFFNSLPVPVYAQGDNLNSSFTCGSGGQHWMNVWIDFNDDGVLAASEQVLTNLSVPGTTPVSTVIPIPGSATPGNHLMRVICYYGTSSTANPPSCGPFSYGETEDYMVNISIATGIQQGGFNSNLFSLYPNPANDAVTISIAKSDNAKVSVYDAVGSLVYTADVKTGNTEINTTGFAPGIYTVKLLNGTESASKKLVICK